MEDRYVMFRGYVCCCDGLFVLVSASLSMPAMYATLARSVEIDSSCRLNS